MNEGGVMMMYKNRFTNYFNIVFFIISAIIIKEMLSGNKYVIILVTSGIFIPYITKNIKL